MNQEIADICREAKITDHLASKGYTFTRSGMRQKCCCPLHSEKTPSFLVTTMADGTEFFKCFGCGEHGSIITLIAKMENIKNGVVVKRLANKLKIKLGKFDESERVEPLNDEILEYFCNEDDMLLEMADYVVPFLNKNPTQDVVNKISRVYENIDKCAAVGDEVGIMQNICKVLAITTSYSAVDMECENVN